MGARIGIGDRPVTSEDLHDITDVVMNALHHSFSDRVLDGRAVVAALLASALGVLQHDLHDASPQATARAFIDSIDMRDITPFTPTKRG